MLIRNLNLVLTHRAICCRDFVAELTVAKRRKQVVHRVSLWVIARVFNKIMGEPTDQIDHGLDNLYFPFIYPRM